MITVRPCGSVPSRRACVRSIPVAAAVLPRPGVAAKQRSGFALLRAHVTLEAFVCNHSAAQRVYFTAQNEIMDEAGQCPETSRAGALISYMTGPYVRATQIVRYQKEMPEQLPQV